MKLYKYEFDIDELIGKDFKGSFPYSVRVYEVEAKTKIYSGEHMRINKEEVDSFHARFYGKSYYLYTFNSDVKAVEKRIKDFAIAVIEKHIKNAQEEIRKNNELLELAKNNPLKEFVWDSKKYCYREITEEEKAKRNIE